MSSLDSKIIRKVGEKKVAVIIGRFNPPTIGHYKLINFVKSFIKNNKKHGLDLIPVVVVIEGNTTKLDKEINPLSGKDRILFMESSGNADGVKFIVASNAFDALKKVRDLNLEPIAVAAGPERLKDYIAILDKYFLDDSGNPVEHIKIGLPRRNIKMLDKSENTDDRQQYLNSILERLKNNEKVEIDEISASLARLAVKNGMTTEFAKIVGLESKPDLANKLFNKIKKVS